VVYIHRRAELLGDSGELLVGECLRHAAKIGESGELE
jgi:hypothetical protein